jgi:hypothetical protein
MFKEPISKYVMFQKSSNIYESLQCMKTFGIMFNDFFEYFILIRFVPNHIKCFPNILKKLP